MKPLSPSLLFVALLISAPGRAAENAADAPPQSPILSAVPPATTSAVSVSNRPRLVSPEVSSRVAATRPKFAPPPAAKDPAESPDLRETDKPRNGIIRLPAYVVREQKFPVFKERDLLTGEGRLREAYRRRPGLRFGSLPFLNNHGIALGMFQEDLRLERLIEFYDLVGLLPSQNRAGANSVLRDSQQSFRHSNEWINDPPGTWAGSWAQRKLR